MRTSAPGRLTLDTWAQDFGLIPPCRLSVNFNVARNSGLRALAVQLRLLDSAQRTIHEERHKLALTGPAGGLWRAEAAVKPLRGHRCRELTLIVGINRCQNEHGSAIACPQLRLRDSLVLRSLDAAESGVAVCYDD